MADEIMQFILKDVVFSLMNTTQSNTTGFFWDVYAAKIQSSKIHSKHHILVYVPSSQSEFEAKIIGLPPKWECIKFKSIDEKLYSLGKPISEQGWYYPKTGIDTVFQMVDNNFTEYAYYGPHGILFKVTVDKPIRERHASLKPLLLGWNAVIEKQT